ncbi:MAG: hypothetical protein IKU17_06995 [Clostridia bacterium]|nr:hypothetical protein [Clostridia bacterium]
MVEYTYDFPEQIREILKDAKPVMPEVKHGNSREGHQSLFQGSAGRFLVHVRQDYWGGPMVRILEVPKEIPDNGCERYAAENERQYSQWYNMVLCNVT